MAGEHTFLFVDLVGFTALAESSGDQRALEVALAFHRRVRALLAAHRAEEVKVLGDGMMLRCSDPVDGVRLGLRLVDGQEDESPPARVGVHTGPALSSAGDWYGTTVNVAARLCAVAPGGEVLVSEATRRAVDRLDGVDWGPRELHWLRNISQPLAAFLVSGPETAPAVPVAPRRRPFARLSWRCPMARQVTA